MIQEKKLTEDPSAFIGFDVKLFFSALLCNHCNAAQTHHAHNCCSQPQEGCVVVAGVGNGGQSAAVGCGGGGHCVAANIAQAALVCVSVCCDFGLSTAGAFLEVLKKLSKNMKQ